MEGIVFFDLINFNFWWFILFITSLISFGLSRSCRRSNRTKTESWRGKSGFLSKVTFNLGLISTPFEFSRQNSLQFSLKLTFHPVKLGWNWYFARLKLSNMHHFRFRILWNCTFSNIWCPLFGGKIQMWSNSLKRVWLLKKTYLNLQNLNQMKILI